MQEKQAGIQKHMKLADEDKYSNRKRQYTIKSICNMKIHFEFQYNH